MDDGILALLTVGFGLGLVHALDADHVAAVSTLAARRPGLLGSLKFAVRWAAGHGVALLGVGGLSFLAGLTIPEAFSRWSELAVGVVLIGLGAWVTSRVAVRPVHVHFHEHDELPAHAHWHEHSPGEQRGGEHDEAHARAGSHDHAPVLVGALHGMAGSAPLLALVPAVAQGSPALGLAYLAVFSVGVLLSMLVFGGLLGGLFEGLLRRGNSLTVRGVQAASGLASIAAGALLIWISW